MVLVAMQFNSAGADVQTNRVDLEEEYRKDVVVCVARDRSKMQQQSINGTGKVNFTSTASIDRYIANL